MIIGINGFGRIGKQVYRILIRNKIKVALINDPFIDLEYLFYLAKYDSIYGALEDIELASSSIIAHGIETYLSSHSEPENIDWPKYEVDYVLECSGKFSTIEACNKHKAKRVLLSSPSKTIPMFVYGVNHLSYDDEKVISCASCTTNCIAPLAKILNDNFNIIEGFITTVHSMTGSQKTVDLKGKDWRESRGIMNIIPASTGAASAVAEVLPSLKGKLHSTAFRVPVSDVSVIDFVVRVEKDTSLAIIKEAIENSKDEYLLSIMGVTEDEVVSSDFIGDPRSSILDYKASMMLNKNFFKLISWYDNEYGYSCRMVDMLLYIADLERKLDNDPKRVRIEMISSNTEDSKESATPSN